MYYCGSRHYCASNANFKFNPKAPTAYDDYDDYDIEIDLNIPVEQQNDISNENPQNAFSFGKSQNGFSFGKSQNAISNEKPQNGFSFGKSQNVFSFEKSQNDILNENPQNAISSAEPLNAISSMEPLNAITLNDFSSGEPSNPNTRVNILDSTILTKKEFARIQPCRIKKTSTSKTVSSKGITKKRHYIISNTQGAKQPVSIIEAIMHCAIKKIGIEILHNNPLTKNLTIMVNDFTSFVGHMKKLNDSTRDTPQNTACIMQSLRVWFKTVPYVDSINDAKLCIKTKKYHDINNIICSM